jgi:hypothetical protein
MALLDGTITPAMMEAQRFMDGDVLQLMGRCTIELPDEFADIAPAIRCCRLTARMKTGETVIVEERRSLEDDVADPGWNCSVEKFSALTADVLAAGGTQRVIAGIENLDRQPTTDELIEATRLRAA